MRLMAMVHIEEIVNISDCETEIAVDCGSSFTMFYENKPLEVKVGSNKVKVSMLDFMQAFKDMLDTGVFELDQIDSEVWDIENKLEVLGNQNDYLNETLREIRGGC